MNKTVDTLRAKLSELNQQANVDLTKIPASTRPGWESKKRKATESLEGVENELTQAIFQNSVVVVLEDAIKAADETVKTIRDSEGGDYVINLDYLELDNRVTKELFSRVTNGTFPFNGPTASYLNRILADIGNDLGAVRMPTVNLPANSRGVLSTFEEARNLVSELLTETFGADLKNLYLRKRLMEEGKKRLTHDRFAIMLTNVPTSELANANSVLAAKGVVLATSDEQTLSAEGVLSAVSVSPDANADTVVGQIALAVKTVTGKKKSRKKVDENDEQ